MLYDIIHVEVINIIVFCSSLITTFIANDNFAILNQFQIEIWKTIHRFDSFCRLPDIIKKKGRRFNLFIGISIIPSFHF